MLCFRNIPEAKKFMDKRGEGGGEEGVSRFSVKNFLSYTAEGFRRGILYASLIWGIENCWE